MDYRNILDLLYIANVEVWFSPDNGGRYVSDSLLGSEETWSRFWELAKINGVEEKCDSYLNDFLWKKYGTRKKENHWFFNTTEQYCDWYSEIVPLLEEYGYPMYPNELIFSDRELVSDPNYIRYCRERDTVMKELYEYYVTE